MKDDKNKENIFSKIFKRHPKLDVPKEVKKLINRNMISFTDYLKYDLKDKVGFECLKYPDIEIIKHFGYEKCLTFDWKFIDNYANKYNTIEINGKTEEIINYLLKQPTDIDFNSFMLDVVNNTPGAYLPQYLREKYPDHYIIDDSLTSEQSKVSNNYNYGTISIFDIIKNWELFKDKNLTYPLLHNKDYANITENELRNAIDKYQKIINLFTSEDLKNFNFNADTKLSEFIKKVNSPNSEEVADYLEQVSKKILTRLTDDSIYDYNNLINKIDNEIYDTIFSMQKDKKKALIDYIHTLKKAYTPKLYNELEKLDYEFIINSKIKLSAYRDYDTQYFIEEYGLENIINFDNECDHFFSNDNSKMLKLMFPMYLSYDHMRKYRKVPQGSYDEYGRFYVEDVMYTKDEFYEIIRKMLLEGPTNWDYVKKAPDYRELKGKFREKNPDLFISQEAPKELQTAFYEKSVTPEMLSEHPEYIPFIKGKSIKTFFSKTWVYINDNNNNYKDTVNFYDFISEKASEEEVFDFIVEYESIINAILYKRNNRMELLEDDTISDIEIKLIDVMKEAIINGNKYPKHMPEKFKERYPKYFLPDDAPKELQEMFYNRTITPSIINDKTEYIPYLKNVKLETIFGYYPIYVQDKNQNTKEVNFVNFIEEKIGSIESMKILLEYKDIVGILRKRIVISEDDTISDIEIKLIDMMKEFIIKGNKYPEHIPEKFKERHPKYVLPGDAPKKLQEMFYNRTITPSIINNNPEYISYLKKAKLETVFEYYPIYVQDKNQNTKVVNLVDLIEENIGYAEGMKVMLEYGNFIKILLFRNINIKEVFSEEQLLNKIDSLMYEQINTNGIIYGKNAPRHFKQKYPQLFLPEEIDDVLKEKFYNKTLSSKDFYENPNLISKIGNTNMIYGFPKEYSFIDSLYSSEENKEKADYLKLKTIALCEQLIKDNGLFKEVKNYILNNKENIKLEDISKVIEVLKKLLYSNSKELYNFRDSIATLIMKTDNPIESFEKIEKIFITNNLPLFGKVFSCFQIIYPNLDDNFNFYADRMSPELMNISMPKVGIKGQDYNENRFRIIYNDLLRISVKSNNRSLREYLDNIDKGNKLYEKLESGEVEYNNLTQKEQKILDTFISHLEVLYENTRDGKEEKLSLENESITNKIRILSKKFKTNERYDLKDRIVRSFAYFAGYDSFQSIIEDMDKSVKEADERGRRRAKELKEKEFRFEYNDFLRGIGDYQVLSNSLNSGNVCKEYLGTFTGTSSSDTTPLDVDLTLITRTSNVYDAVNNTPTGFGFGNVFVIMKHDNPNLNITRDESGLINAKYDPKKAEIFRTGYETHWGIRTGFAFTDVDYILYKEPQIINTKTTQNEYIDKYGNKYLSEEPQVDEDGNILYNIAVTANSGELKKIKFEIAKNGYYIPVIDFKGRLIFTPEEYDKLREQMQGLSYYDMKEYHFSNNIDNEEVKEIVKNLDKSEQEVVGKRNKIYKVLNEVFEKYNLKLRTKIDSDLTPGYVELIDTGSTGRKTNKIGDGDFDFVMRLDQQLILNSKLYNEFKTDIVRALEKNGVEQTIFVDDGIRLKGVKLDDETTVDIDISYLVKTDKISYSTDLCIKDRLETIQKQDPEKYKQVIANIILAKKVLKEAGVYKSFHSREAEGGLGGVGVENWILQHGGSFIDAANSFIDAAKNRSFEDFKQVYTVWDFGENFFAEKKGIYKYDEFINNNMNSDGYDKMCIALKNYLSKQNNNELNAMFEEKNSEQEFNITK